MASLEGLPYDVKFTLLETLTTDYDTFISLVVTSRDFYDIFKKYKRCLLGNVDFYDAAKYWEESFLVACLPEIVGDPVHSIDISYSEIREIEDSYISAMGSPRPNPDSESWYYTRVWEGGQEMKARITANHRAIRRLCEQFIRRAMYPRFLVAKQGSRSKKDYLEANSPATPTEREKIMRGFYRLWLLTRLFYSSKSESSSMGENDLSMRYVPMWDFWDLGVIQMLLSYISMELKPVFMYLWDNSLWWYALAFNLPTRATNKTTGKKIEEKRRKPLMQDHVSGSMFAFLVFEYPFHAPEWIENATDFKSLSDRCEKIFSVTEKMEIREQIGKARYLHLGHPDGWLGAGYRFPGRVFRPEDTSTIPIRRICLPGEEDYSKYGEQAKLIWLNDLTKAYAADSSSLLNIFAPKPDPWVSVWDDWRLEEWGYRFPRLAALKRESI
ncbi:hypothetical protein TWF696_008827 [Orbilia brochopaga]|uniref:Uncharacterized protein n=1 Tax=Orbilia brochopaga TaxID=3140254 RepID=A0AAV9UE40_9PEZI